MHRDNLLLGGVPWLEQYGIKCLLSRPDPFALFSFHIARRAGEREIRGEDEADHGGNLASVEIIGLDNQHRPPKSGAGALRPRSAAHQRSPRCITRGLSQEHCIASRPEVLCSTVDEQLQLGVELVVRAASAVESGAEIHRRAKLRGVRRSSRSARSPVELGLGRFQLSFGGAKPFAAIVRFDAVDQGLTDKVFKSCGKVSGQISLQGSLYLLREALGIWVVYFSTNLLEAIP